MKGIFKSLIIFFTLILLSTKNTYGFKLEKYSSENETINPANNPITHQQTKGQVHLFQQALDEFGATSPEQVIEIWTKAESTRNGVFHYAVSCDELKSKIIKDWGKPEDNYWIYGGSSPWLDKYEVVYNRKLSDSLYEAKIKFFWSTSLGPSNTSETTLTIIKNKDIWCVKEAKSN